jgi:hypothetical protein
MATIDVGPGATDRGSYITYGNTVVDINNPANGTGTLDTFEIFAVSGYDLTNTAIGTFSGSDTSYDDRDYETIGSVTSGSKQTFTGKNCDVSSGDFLGVYHSNGRIERDTSGYSGIYYKVGNKFNTGANTYGLYSGDAISIYATGETAAAGNPYYYYLQQ